ncbi:MAG TPA: hypothetical protein VJ725_09640 [Thermoanaerobaculia bacterium]|nr:hypothetical protein [Thermoanaerobaculia bacterium]
MLKLGQRLLLFLLLWAPGALWAQCQPGATNLCLNNNNFRVSATWKTPDGASGKGQAVSLTSDTGYFWFFSPDNVETVVKVLDGCGLNNRFWVFAAGLTNVEVTLTVEHVVPGRRTATKTYRNPQGTSFAPIQDTSAFTGCSTGRSEAPPLSVEQAAAAVAQDLSDLAQADDPTPLVPGVPNRISQAAVGACVATDTTLCLGDRFRISGTWRTPSGSQGPARAVRLTADTGYFWFFSPANVEMIVKVLNACTLNNRFWVFAGGLTDVRVDFTVEDTVTGAVATYRNPRGTPFQPIQDTNALSTCQGELPPPLKDTTVAPLPALSVDPPRPAGGEPATLRVDWPGATSLSLTATGLGCGGFSTHTANLSRLEVVRNVAEFGECHLVAQAVTGSTTRTFQSTFTVEPADLLLPAVELLGGVFVPGTLPAPTGAGAPEITAIDAPSTIINGGTARLRIALQNPAAAANVNRILVQVPGVTGFQGYFEAPVRREGNVLIAEIRLDPDFPASTLDRQNRRFAALKATGPIDIVVQLIDFLGRVGRAVLRPFEVQPVGSGDVQVSLSWDTQTDVDLHVVEPPGGEEIYWSNRSSVTGGTLDLDSNAACSIDGVNNENITWTTGSPIVGEHIVRVDFWSDCGGSPANYVVTTKVCGEVKTFPGAFAAGTDDQGGSGSGREITRFTPNCGFRVRGKAVYQDKAQTTSGLSGTTTELPIRYARIEVKRASDNVTLGESDTKQDGSFDISFQNNGAHGYYLVVMADQDNEFVNQAVKNDRDEIYSMRSTGTINESNEPDKTDVMIRAQANSAGPAFNIFDMGVVGADLYRRHSGSTPPHLDWLWTQGRQGACSSEVSCYSRSRNQISVLSISADPDEYDDLVLLHEFGHKWQYEQSRSDSPGGDHSSDSQVDPQLAWGEGSATFFGNTAKGTSLYLDTTSSGVGVRLDIESLATTIPQGTSGNTQNGDLSEAVVAAVLWDLADGTNETRDTLTNEAGVFSAASYLKSSFYQDRGTSGADLVDLLDGWFCRGNGSEGDDNKGVKGILKLHSFPYDFAAQSSCQ